MTLGASEARRVDGAGFPDDFPAWVERLQEASGLTWREFAGRLGVNVRSVHRWRRGSRPDSAHLLALFRFAGEAEPLESLTADRLGERQDGRQALLLSEEEWKRLGPQRPQPAVWSDHAA